MVKRQKEPARMGRLFAWMAAGVYLRRQMSLLYWAMVRSLEKKPLLAVFTSIFRAQKGLSP